MNFLRTYLSELQTIHSSGMGVKETSYYPAVSTLFNAVGKTLRPGVRCIINLKNSGAGIPDGGFFTSDQFSKTGEATFGPGQLPSRGVLEVKGTGEAVQKIAASDQVEKYWQKYGQVLVTNLREFVLVGRDENGHKVVLETFALAPTEAEFWALAASSQASDSHEEQFSEYLKRVLLYAAPLAAPEDVAWFLASYARDAKNRIALAGLPALASVRTALEEALGLKFDGVKGEHFFRSTLVQTLFYGVFSAWVLWCRQQNAAALGPKTGQRFEWKMAAWELHVPMIRALFQEVAKPSQLGPLGLVEVLDWTGAALNRVDQAAFFAKFDQAQAVQYFYEPFLSAFDPELRKDLGVWYTPPEIVKYMVARVDAVLQGEMGIPGGLADPNVYVLDPCCGTGAYLVEVLHLIEARLAANGGDALGAADLKKAATTRIFGFEILPAPFVVAHLQLSLLLQTAGAPLAETERAGVYLTNALTGWEPPKEPKSHLLFPELEAERDAADQVKQQKPILVILGNPPYNAFAGTSPAEEQGLVEPYKKNLNKPEADGGWGIKKFNLDELYVRFFRLAERRIAEKEGVVCFISNASYLSDPSFVVMRERFLSEFDTLWFDNLNGDSRETGKMTPDGKPDPSVFSTQYNREGIRVGTAIGLLVRKKERNAAPTVHFRQFWGVTKRTDLLESLTAPESVAPYLPAAPKKSNRFTFRPSDVTAYYEAWPSLVEFCLHKPFNGPIERRGNALISVQEKSLADRMRSYFDHSVSDEAVKAIYPALMMTGNRIVGPEARAKILKTFQYDEAKIVRYPFKPFDVRWCYLEKLRPLFSEPSPELLEQRFKGNTFLVARENSVIDSASPPFYFSPVVCDYHSLAVEAKHIPMLLKPAAPKNSQKAHGALIEVDTTAVANLSPAARAYLAGLGIDNPDADAETAGLIWMHALAIGYSPAYLTENVDGIRGDWPRIPLPDTQDALWVSAALGRQIAALLDTETAVAGVTAGALRPELAALGTIKRTDGGQLQPDGGDLKVTAGWGHGGKEGVTMPGKGKSTARDFAPAEREALQKGAAALGLTDAQLTACFGPATRDVYLNGIAYWQNVPERVWDYTIGGYQVLKKWLSYREAPLLGRDLTPEEAREVTAMVRRLAALRLLEPALDANYQVVQASAFVWNPAPPEAG